MGLLIPNVSQSRVGLFVIDKNMLGKTRVKKTNMLSNRLKRNIAGACHALT